MTQARQAWDDGEFDRAERSYQQALEQGGLDRASTLECYVHLGAIRAVLGKKEKALVDFRTALMIDDGFSVPPEAGKKAAALAQAARRQRGRVGMLHVQVSVPDEVASGGSFAVNVIMDAAQASLLSRLSLHVKDATTNKTWDHDEPAAAVVHFSVPASMTLPNASLRVQVDALDEHDNQLAWGEARTTVRGTPVREGLLDHVAGNRHGEAHHDESKGGGGFWSSPWPYVLGGMALAAGAATGAYFLLKPPDQVSIGPAQMQTY
ncbi:MAG TPA: tetratricopeptide repeat protein [Polyangiaceae bacterium]|nr:tetratricopeptide repeat protein [Polyangiaceae bacterium]